jgi:hypothetical protein
VEIVKHPLQGGASRSLIILFRYMPLDPAYQAGLARHETGHLTVVLTRRNMARSKRKKVIKRHRNEVKLKRRKEKAKAAAKKKKSPEAKKVAP